MTELYRQRVKSEVQISVVRRGGFDETIMRLGVAVAVLHRLPRRIGDA